MTLSIDPIKDRVDILTQQTNDNIIEKLLPDYFNKVFNEYAFKYHLLGTATYQHYKPIGKELKLPGLKLILDGMENGQAIIDGKARSELISALKAIYPDQPNEDKKKGFPWL